MNSSTQIGIAIHGGAGTILKEKMTPEKEKEYRQKLKESLNTGYAILEKGGTALDAVQNSVNVMEDSPLFNAGKGAVFTSDEKNEQDAMIIDGSTLQSGAVACVRHIKNPINLARIVMDKSEHILLISDGAEEFAKANNVEFADEEYFFTEHRWKQLQNAKADPHKSILDHSDDKQLGTVGAVALDKGGKLAAATSTGGMTNKKYGRVGDTPLIGCGTYANRVCAVSATGQGEYIMRAMIGYDIAALMEYKHLSLHDAAHTCVIQKLSLLGGQGGVVAIDRDGNISMPFNTPGMYRAYIKNNSEPVVAIFKE